MKNGTVHVDRLDQWENRGDNAAALMQGLVDLKPALLEGRNGCIYYADAPPSSRTGSWLDLRFCSTVRIGEPSEFLPFPCPYSLAWPQVGIDDGSALTTDLLDYQGAWRDRRAFWIGADTHPTRRALASLSDRNPAILDAALMGWQRGGPEVRLPSTARYVSLWDHRHYKYLIDCPGFGYSGRLRWLLASGRPVFVIERPVIEPWHLDLRPWVHFIPVKQDLSDLIASYQRIENDPTLYQLISANARAFARSRLVRERELARIAGIIPPPRRRPPSALVQNSGREI